MMNVMAKVRCNQAILSGTGVPTIIQMVQVIKLPRNLIVVLTGQNMASVRYTNLNEANIGLDLPAYGSHI